MAIPQTAVTALLLVNILLCALPENLSDDIELVQCAHDIRTWMKVTKKRKTPLTGMVSKLHAFNAKPTSTVISRQYTDIKTDGKTVNLDMNIVATDKLSCPPTSGS